MKIMKKALGWRGLRVWVVFVLLVAGASGVKAGCAAGASATAKPSPSVTDKQGGSHSSDDECDFYFGPPYFCVASNSTKDPGRRGCPPWAGSYSSLSETIAVWDAAYRASKYYKDCHSYKLTFYDPYRNCDGDVAGTVVYDKKGAWCGEAMFLAYRYRYKPGKNTGKSCDCAGDPIAFGTGNEYRDEEDIAAGILSLHRYYNSHQATASAQLGAHWRHSFNRSLEYLYDSNSSTVTVFRPDGRQVVFTPQGHGWVTDADVADKLEPQYNAIGQIQGWRFFDAATHEQEEYDAQGLLRAITDANRQRIVLRYSDAKTPKEIAPSPGLLLTVTDPQGRQLKFSYTRQDKDKAPIQLNTITQLDGGLIHYSYDDNNNLIKVAYSDDHVQQYLYKKAWTDADPSYLLTGVIDENGTRLSEISYDYQGRAILSRQAGNVETTEVGYGGDRDGELDSSTVIYPNGAEVTYGFRTPQGAVRASSASAPCGVDCGQPYTSQTFGDNGYPASAIDFAGHTIQWNYNRSGLLESQIEAVGEKSQRTTKTVWNNALRVPLKRTISDTQGKVTSLTAWSYNSWGQVTARCELDPASASGYNCDPTGTAPSGVQRWTYSYCDSADKGQCPVEGLRLSATGPVNGSGQQVSYRYQYYTKTDESGCDSWGGACHHAGDLYQISDNLGHTLKNLSYDKNGRITRQADSNGTITDFTYSPRGWLLGSIVRHRADGAPSGFEASTWIGYTPSGQVSRIIDADKVRLDFTYDAAQRLTAISDAQGNRIQYTLDGASHITQEQIFDKDGTLYRALSRNYNTLGQLAKLTDGLGNAVFNATEGDSYDGNNQLNHSSDALRVARKQQHDGLNRLVQTLDSYNGGDKTTKNSQTSFSYNARDQLSAISDPDSLTTGYRYDGLGNATAIQSPDSGNSSLQYDAAGNVTQRTDAEGNTSRYSYDALNRRTQVSYTDSSQNVSYHYDEANSVTGCTSSYPIGRLTQIIEANVSTRYCYDNQGRVTEKRQIQGDHKAVTRYAYTSAGRLAQTTTPNGIVVDNQRDATGQIVAVAVTTASGSQQVARKVSYQPLGPIQNYTLGNDQLVTRSYDANGALSALQSPVYNLALQRNAMGNIVKATENNTSESYHYDSLYRLLNLQDAHGKTEEAYTYSQAGDRLSKTGAGLATGSYSYQSGSHQLLGIGNDTRRYDHNGNTIGATQGSKTYHYNYNARQRLTQVQQAGATVGSYTYNALGQRIAKQAKGSSADVSARFVYDEEGRLLSEISDNSSRDYIWLDDMPIAVVDIQGNASTINYVIADGLNTPRAISNAQGKLVWQWPYVANPFGEQPPKAPGFTYNLRFSGQYYDQESGLLQNGYRDYDPATSRYLQADPIGLNGGLNPYTYAGNNPLSQFDRNGLNPVAGAIEGGEVGLTVGGPVGAVIGGVIGAGLGWWGMDWAMDHLALAKPKPGSKPKGCPAGTLPINKSGLSREEIHKIKGPDGINARPNDWTGIAPNGDVISGDHEGNAVNHGPKESFLN